VNVACRQKGIGLSEEQLHERHILPENRVHPGLKDPDCP
jgi:hypothetical protein